MGRINTSSRYVIDIIGTDPFSFDELGPVNLEKLMSQSSYFQSRRDLLTLGGVRGVNRKSWKMLRVEESG